jgi:hypothetical protein
MAVSSELRRSDRFIGDGSQVSFPFEFKVFQNDQIEVVVADASGNESVLDPELYSVFLSGDQDNKPGGTVTLTRPLGVSSVLVILSKVPALQQTVFTNRGGFFPEVLNDCNDLAVILVQQLKEKLERTLSVPVTSERTPEQVVSEILDIAAQANSFAQQAAETYQAVLQTKALVEQTRVHVDQQKALVDASEAEVEEDRLEVEQMLGEAKEVNEVASIVAPHIDEVVAVGNSIEDIKAIASELQGLPILSMDLGLVSEEATPIQDTSGSNIAFLAANIDKIQLAIDNLDEIQAAAEAALRAETAARSAETSAANASVFADEAEATVERVKEIEKTDFEQIYEQGAS